MSASFIINNDRQTNGSISIVLPMPSITLQFPTDFGLTTGLTIQITQCAVPKTNEINEEKMETQEEKVETKEKADIKDNINIKEEPIFDFKMDDDDLQNDPNLTPLRFSPVSSPDFEDEEYEENEENEENDESSIVSEQDEISERYYTDCVNELMQYVEYLKEGIEFD